MRVAANVLAIPLLSDEYPESTMFPAVRTSPSTLPLHIPQLQTSQVTKPYAATYCLAVLMRRALQQLAAHLMPTLHLPQYCSTPRLICSHHWIEPSTPSMMTLKMKKISKQLHRMMTIGLQTQFLTDICVSMNIHS